LKQGFTANFGVSFVISVDSGQVLDYGFASKICLQCSREKEQVSKNSEEFRNWYATHSSNCTENHTGSSEAMEKDIARRLWSNSLAYNLRYKYMVCDGNSKAYNSVWDVYGAVKIVISGSEWTKRATNTRNGSTLMTITNGNQTMTLDKQTV